MKMRKSIADIEAAFAEETAEDRQRAVALRRRAELRARQRRIERQHRHGSLRFWMVLLILLGTAVLVTVLMFQALYWVMG
jgi:hypothetical protein